MQEFQAAVRQKAHIAMSGSQLFVMEVSNGVSQTEANKFQPGKHFILLKSLYQCLYFPLACSSEIAIKHCWISQVVLVAHLASL